MELSLSTPLVRLADFAIPRVARVTANKLATEVSNSLGYADPRRASVADLLSYLPFRYEDRTHLAKIAELRENVATTIEAEIRVLGSYRVKGGRLQIFEFAAMDDTGQIRALWWNQVYLEKYFQRGQRVYLYGVWKRGRRGVFEIVNPDYELVATDEDDTASIHTGRCVPVYRKLGSFRTRQLRSIVSRVLDRLPAPSLADALPKEVVDRHRLMPRGQALHEVHFPSDGGALEAFARFSSPAQRRLIFEEFFWLSLAIGLKREKRIAQTKGTVIEIDDRIRRICRSILPFKLTGAQRQVLKEIASDLQAPRPMHRLLQGDVGSGKTIVALLAMVLAIENGYQTALMAPTEILAEQHARTVKRWLAGTPYRVELLTSGVTAAKRRQLREALSSGELDLAIGTHALIQEGVTFHRLGLAVIDEQHRFGVMQRAELTKRGYNPDVLVMTATPIPRSLAMTLYGDLDVSVIDELPPGRQPVITRVRDERARASIYEFLVKQIEKGRQIYVVCPLVEESDPARRDDLKNATEMAGKLQHGPFRGYSVGLLHGRMKAAEKEAVMQHFAAGEIQVLVSTTVIEVGVDVPNASVMLIEHAERFGLSQLHQLRGRVGRGSEKSYCILLAGESQSEEARERLAVMEKTNDGFVIAEKDLELRGPGDLLGVRQHGTPLLRIANLARDQKLLESAKREVEFLLSSKRNSREVLALEEQVRSRPEYGMSLTG